MSSHDPHGPSANTEERKVFVGGVPYGVDQHVVREDFMRFGEIEDVFLPVERETGKLRGFAFVTFRNSKDAHEAAGAMHGRDYHGRQISVTIAKPRDPLNPDEGGKGKGKGGGGGVGPGAYSYSRPRDYWSGWEDRQRLQEKKERDDRERDHHEDNDGYGRYGMSGRYGDRDPRPVQEYYD